MIPTFRAVLRPEVEAASATDQLMVEQRYRRVPCDDTTILDRCTGELSANTIAQPPEFRFARQEKDNKTGRPGGASLCGLRLGCWKNSAAFANERRIVAIVDV